MEELSAILWRERELLGMLLYKLEQEQLVLASGKTRWLGTAASEVETVLGLIHQTEVLRAISVDEVARSLGMAPNPGLSDLAQHAGEPWASILLDHRDVFLSYTRQITEMAGANRDLLTTGARAAREMLLSVTDGSQTYSPDGSAVAAGPGRRLVDRII